MVLGQVREAVSEVLGRLVARVREERWVEDTLRLRVTVRSFVLQTQPGSVQVPGHRVGAPLQGAGGGGGQGGRQGGGEQALPAHHGEHGGPATGHPLQRLRQGVEAGRQHPRPLQGHQGSSGAAAVHPRADPGEEAGRPGEEGGEGGDREDLHQGGDREEEGGGPGQEGEGEAEEHHLLGVVTGDGGCGLDHVMSIGGEPGLLFQSGRPRMSNYEANPVGFLYERYQSSGVSPLYEVTSSHPPPQLPTAKY